LELRRLFLLATLPLLLAFCAGCGQTRTVVLPATDRVFRIEQGRPVWDGQPYPLSEIEGWYVLSPGNLLQYAEYMAAKRKREREAEIPGGGQ